MQLQNNTCSLAVDFGALEEALAFDMSVRGTRLNPKPSTMRATLSLEHGGIIVARTAHTHYLRWATQAPGRCSSAQAHLNRGGDLPPRVGRVYPEVRCGSEHSKVVPRTLKPSEHHLAEIAGGHPYKGPIVDAVSCWFRAALKVALLFSKGAGRGEARIIDIYIYIHTHTYIGTVITKVNRSNGFISMHVPVTCSDSRGMRTELQEHTSAHVQGHTEYL